MAGKTRYVNPFKPTAGMTPPVLIGRDSVIDDFIDGMDEGPGAPGRLLRITGPRGSGKTVLLTELGGIASDRGWTVINVSGKEALCQSIEEQLAVNARLRSLDIKISVPFVTAEAHLENARAEIGFRESFSGVVRALTKKGFGLLIAVDEVQDASPDDMAVLATNVQYMIREQQNIALLFAGITTGVLNLLNGEGITFLRRARAEELGSIPVDEVASAMKETIDASGLEIDDDALSCAAETTHGYAYLIQMVGYYVWRTGRRHASSSRLITLDDAKRGCAEALREFGSSVLETALAGLTRPAMEYLFAMTKDDAASATSAVAERMGVPAPNANTYRRVLIDRQIIESTAPGYVAFSIPFMREYLIENREEILSRYGG
jgi:energy-coupling factor transporter ATP-binding protein EcfA2